VLTIAHTIIPELHLNACYYLHTLLISEDVYQLLSKHQHVIADALQAWQSNRQVWLSSYQSQ